MSAAETVTPRYFARQTRLHRYPGAASGTARRLRTSGVRVQAQDRPSCLIAYPDFAVDFAVARGGTGEFAVIAIHFRRQPVDFEFRSLAIELRNAGLEGHGDPDVLVVIEFHVKVSVDVPRLEHGNWIFSGLAGFRIELAENRFAETRVPHRSVSIHHHVVGLACALG